MAATALVTATATESYEQTVRRLAKENYALNEMGAEMLVNLIANPTTDPALVKAGLTTNLRAMIEFARKQTS